MKKFKITTIHDVYFDSYENGQGKQANYYHLNKTIKADSIKQAIEEYFKNMLFYTLNFEYADTNDEKTVMFYSVMVDENNAEATEREIELWKEDKRQLFSNNIQLTIEELTNVEISL